MQTVPSMTEMLTSIIILYTLRNVIGDKANIEDTVNLVQLWCLDRKIRDILVSYGLPSKDMYETFKIMQAVTPFCDEKLHAAKLRNSAYSLVSTLLASDNAPLVMGSNNFENTLWFNKEKSDFAFNMAIVLYVIFAANPTDYPKLQELIVILQEERDKSGYKAEQLLSQLEPTKQNKSI